MGRHQLMIDPSSLGSGIQTGWTIEARTSMGRTERTLENYAEKNPTRYKIGNVILCALGLKTTWETIHYCLTSKGYKGFVPVYLSILYDAKILRGWEIMRNLL